jgi:NADH-quinone oxidoreductase subunit N
VSPLDLLVAMPTPTQAAGYSPGQAWHDLQQVAPIVAVAVAMLVGMVADLVLPRSVRGGTVAAVAVLGYLAALVLAVVRWIAGDGGYAYFGFASGDRFALFFEMVFAVLGLLTVAIAEPYLRRRSLLKPEFHVLTLAAVAGMMALAAATSLVTVFLSLETFSVALYVLSSYVRRDTRSQEAGAKYLLVGGFASAILLYGMALTYGATGTTQVDEIASRVSSQGVGNPLLVLGVVLMGVGFAYKISGAPFHQWTPDVYQGAPLPVTAFMSVGTKAAAFAMILTVFGNALGHLDGLWQALLAFVAVSSMVVGNLGAIAQSSVKRMLAYSSIAQGGYVLIGVIAGGGNGVGAVLFYLAAYLFMNFGAFAILTLVSGREVDADRFTDLDGLGYRHPLAGVAMTIFMLSLAGFPPTVGFFGKLFLFTAAVSGGWTWLVIVGALASAVSVAYYLRVVLHVWTPARGRREEPERRITPAKLAVAAAAALVLALGLYPTLLIGGSILAAAPVFAGH